jgi:hypothetical protein
VLLVVIFALGAGVRLNVLRWEAPFTPHHPDEAILPLEAVALWEGITPREVGWPASTTRLLLSGTFAVRWAADRSSQAAAGGAMGVVDDIAARIGAQYVDSTSLFRTARGLMIAIGLLQLAALVWALRQWTGWAGTLTATLGAAIAPLAVSHSQYVLADMTGVLFATLIVGLAGRPATMSRVLGMAALTALAASSKFHFAIWLLAPLGVIWFSAATLPVKFRQTAGMLAVFAGVLVALVPWLWLNPVLFVKEFAGVVLVKVASSTPVPPVRNAVEILRGLGAVTLVGALLGVAIAARRRMRELLAIAIPVAMAIAALTGSAIVFDRYGLVVLPGLSLLTAIG